MNSDALLTDDGKPRHGAPLSDLIAAQASRQPDAPALTLSDGVVVTYSDLERRTNQRARQLASAGLRPNGILLIALPNGRDFYEAAIAAWKVGATPLHVSPNLSEREFSEIVAMAQPDVVLNASAPCLSEDLDATPLQTAIAKNWRISTSGGSTGRPKLIIDPHPAVWSDEKVALRRGAHPVIVNPAPLYHSGPFNLMISALFEGGHVIEMGRFDPERFLTLVSQYRATWAYLVPTMMSRVAKLPADLVARFDLSSIETLLHTAAACPPDVKRFWIDLLGPDAVWELYGGAERVGYCLIGGREWLAHPGSVGRPTRPGVKVRILTEEGDEAPRGAIGDIYFWRDDGVDSAFQYVGGEMRRHGDWASFGDLGWMDEDGYLYLADRRTDMIVTGGANIFPAEIEAQIDSLPDVVSSVVVGAPHEDLGEVVCAFVQLRDNAERLSSEDFIAQLSARLSREKLPRLVRFVEEDIRDMAGKVRRLQWRDRIRSELAKR